MVGRLPKLLTQFHQNYIFVAHHRALRRSAAGLPSGALAFLGSAMRTYVYVDGFNLYNSGLKQDPASRWLDIRALCQAVLGPQNQLDCIRYFTARISGEPGDPSGPNRQDVYLRALRSHIPELTTHLGQFRSNNRRRPLANPQQGQPKTVEIIERSEKGSDVNLAANLVNDSWANVFDCAVVVSNDSDLAEALCLAKAQNKILGLLTTAQRPTGSLMKHANFYRHITQTHFRNSQLPDPVLDPTTGREIRRPPKWA